MIPTQSRRHKMERRPAQEKRTCMACGVKFTHQSSLIRHVRNKCNRNQPQRRKACNQCASDKARCSLRRPSCSRCQTRGIHCQYTAAEEPNTPRSGAGELRIEEEDMPDFSTTEVLNTFQPQLFQSAFDPNLFDAFFSDLPPWSSVLPSDLALRSLQNSGTSGQEAASCDNSRRGSLQLQNPPRFSSAALANHSMELIFRVLRTWPCMLAEEFQVPPLFHFTHFAQPESLPRSLATCISLAKMWNGHYAGAQEMVRSTVLKELDLIVQSPEELDGKNLLAVLQAVVIYTIILLSPSDNLLTPAPDDRIVFRKVEALVYQVVRMGLFLDEERAQTRPCWEDWIHVTAKRRAVLSLYLLHWAYSVLHNVQCFDCSDLGFMPAPAPKVLWQANTEQEWNMKYIHWLSRWSGQIYLQAEFGKIAPGATMNSRAERWLGETDEFGFIMASIVNATDYTPPSVRALRQ